MIAVATTPLLRGMAALLAGVLCCLLWGPGPALAAGKDPADLSPEELKREQRREDRRQELWRSPSLRQRLDDLDSRYRQDLDPDAATEGAYGRESQPDSKDDEPAYGIIQPITPAEREADRKDVGPIQPYEPMFPAKPAPSAPSARRNGPDLATARMSRDKAFQVSYSSDPPPNSQGAPSTWTVKISDSLGVPVTGASITPVAEMPKTGRQVAGGMVAVSEKGGGTYQIRGMAFDRAGWWRVRLIIQARGYADEAVFNLVLR